MSTRLRPILPPGERVQGEGVPCLVASAVALFGIPLACGTAHPGDAAVGSGAAAGFTGAAGEAGDNDSDPDSGGVASAAVGAGGEAATGTGGVAPVATGGSVAAAGAAGGEAGAHCVEGEFESRPCGNCGTQWRVCAEGESWGFCQDEVANPECTPGTSIEVACSGCGHAVYWCSDSLCDWETAECKGTRACDVGTYQVDTASCSQLGTFRVVPCTEECWFNGPWDCHPPPRAADTDLVLRGFFPYVSGATEAATSLFAVDVEYVAPPLMRSIRSGAGARVHRFEWSPDGTRVAYRSKEYTNDVLSVVEMTGEDTGAAVAVGSPRPGIDDSDLFFAWSPVSNELAYVDPGEPLASETTPTGAAGTGAEPAAVASRQIAVARFDTGVPVSVRVSGDLSIEEGDRFYWSPSGQVLALRPQQSSNVLLLDASGTAEPLLVVAGDAAAGGDDIADFAWSPQGEALAWHAPNGSQIFLCRPELAAGILSCPAELLAEATGGGRLGELVWLPDGSGLLARNLITALAEDGESSTEIAETLYVDRRLAWPVMPVKLPSYGSVTRVEARGARVVYSTSNAIWVLDRSSLDALQSTSVSALRVPSATDLTRRAYGERWDLSQDGERLVFVANIARWDLPEVYHLDLSRPEATPQRIGILADRTNVVDVRFGGHQDKYVAYRIQRSLELESCCDNFRQPIVNVCPRNYPICDPDTCACTRIEPTQLFVVPFSAGAPAGPPQQVHQPDPAPPDPVNVSPFEPVEFQFRP